MTNRNHTMSEEKCSMNPTLTMVVSKIDQKQAQDPKNEADQKKGKFDGQHDMPGRTIWVQMALGGDDDDDGGGDPKERNRFVRIVFSIVFLMLLITATFNVIVHLTPLKDFFRSKPGYYFVIGVTFFQFGIFFAVFCFDSLVYPPAITVIVVLTVICMSIITAFTTSVTATMLVVCALGATAVLVIVIILIAYSSWDFTRWWNYIVFASIAFGAVSLMLFAIRMTTKMKMKPVQIAMCAIGTVMQSVVLIMELQTIIGGKTVELDEELYLYGAFQVYTSIISIFLKLLRLMQLASGD